MRASGARGWFVEEKSSGTDQMRETLNGASAVPFPLDLHTSRPFALEPLGRDQFLPRDAGRSVGWLRCFVDATESTEIGYLLGMSAILELKRSAMVLGRRVLCCL
jgi:hypothetical protein